MIKYSKEIGEILTRAGIDRKNIKNLFGSNIVSAKVTDRKFASEIITLMEDSFAEGNFYKKGVFFDLSSGRRDGQRLIYHVSLDSSEIIRLLKLKSFA